jgi:monodehydroascorbate reductase (NADH)
MHATFSGLHLTPPPPPAGSTAEYDYLPFFYSREFSLSWQFYGSSEGTAVHFGDMAAGKFGAYWVDGGRWVGRMRPGAWPHEAWCMAA